MIPRSRLPFIAAAMGFFLVLLFLIPLFLLGPSYLIARMRENWLLYVLLVAACAPVVKSLSFEAKAKKLAKSGDWRGLMALSATAFPGRSARARSLYLCAACIEGDFTAIDVVERRFFESDPKRLERFALWFALSRELRNRPGDAADFLAAHPAKGSRAERRLASLHRAFSLVLARRTEEAFPLLSGLIVSKDPVAAPVAAYLLAGCAALYPASVDRAGSATALGRALSGIVRGPSAGDKWFLLFGRAARDPGYSSLWGLARETATWLNENSGKADIVG